jgi:hypothetical protein
VKVLFLLLLVVLPGCASTTPAATDGDVVVVWNRVDDPHRVCEGLSGRKSFFNVLGCSHRIEPQAAGGPRVCAIYAPEPRTEKDLQRFATLGHELMHCFDGNWHDRWGRVEPKANSLAQK